MSLNRKMQKWIVDSGQWIENYSLSTIHYPLKAPLFIFAVMTLMLNVGFAQRLAFDQTLIRVSEGESVEVVVMLNEASDVDVQVNYSVEDVTAQAGRDYETQSGVLTFSAGVLEQSFTINTLEDGKFEGEEGLKLTIFNPQNARLSFKSDASVRIIDNDPEPVGMLADFETEIELTSFSDAVKLELSPDNALAFPEQQGYETVLQMGDGGLEQVYTTPQNWQAFEGIRFWMYGQNTGETITLELLDNRGAVTAEGWELLWADEFNAEAGTLPNPEVWNYDLGDGTEAGVVGWGNDERQFYTDSPENVFHDGDGNLVIRALELQDSDMPCHYGACQYTAARINTENNFAFAYGRIEGRMKLPFGQGMWPAFWMLGDDFNQVGWPNSGEIDIMEYIGREPLNIHGHVHGPGYAGAGGPGAALRLEDLPAERFHTFSVEWEPDEIRWYTDDELYLTLSPDDVNGEWVFDHSFFVILNLAVGGRWPGLPDSTTVFPQDLVVDYIRVYSLPETSERFETVRIDNFLGWQPIDVPFRHFERSSEQAATAPNDGLTLEQLWAYRLSSSSPILIDQIQLY